MVLHPLLGLSVESVCLSFFLSGAFFLSLRVEFLLKTDIGYPKDTGVTFLGWRDPDFLSFFGDETTGLTKDRFHSIFPGNQNSQFRNPRLNFCLLLPFNSFARQFMGSVFGRITSSGVAKHRTVQVSI